MKPAIRSRSRLVLGTTVLALLVMAVILVLTAVREVPTVRPVPEGRATGAMAGAMGSASRATDVRSDDAGLTETDRQPVIGARETTSRTSLLVTFVDGATGEPVPRLSAALIPKDAVPFAYDDVQGVSDLNGEILWENLSWHQVRVFPPFTEETFALAPGQRNQRTHEVDLTFTIIGTVVDTLGQPVAGAEIWAGRRETLAKVTESDAAGSFSFPVYESVESNVHAWSAGRGPSRTAYVSQPQGAAITELRLQLGDQAGTIIGDVVTRDGTPIPGAIVRSRGSNAFLPAQEDATMVLTGRDRAPLSTPVRSDVGGRFQFDDVPVGEATITVAASGWAGAVAEVNVVGGGTSQIRVTMSRGGRIVGTVRDSVGAPLQGVTLVARYHTFATRFAVTDSSGNYALENVEPGRLRLQASHPLRGERDDTVEVADGQELRWEPVFGAGAGIRGLVLDSEGAPMVERYVLVSGEDGERRRLKTDSQGRFVTLYGKEQAYEIGAYPEGFSAPITVGEGVRPGDEELTFRLPPLPSINASMTGIVLGPGGRPVVPVRIIATESEYAGFALHDLTSPDGRFTLGPMLSGEWSIRIETTEHPRLTLDVVLGPDETKDLGELTFGEAVPVEVLVRGTEGVEGTVAGLLWGGAYENERVPVESGLAQLPPLSAGKYRLEILGQNLARVGLDMELVTGRDAHFEITVQPGVSRSLGVVVPEGASSSRIRFQTFDQNGRELVTWNRRWYSHWGAQPVTFRPEAVRIVVTSDDGLTAEAALGADEEIRLVLR